MAAFQRLLFLVSLGIMAVSTVAQIPAGKGTFWFRGNTHTHARLSDENDVNDVPEIASWYRDAGYSFLCLSEHNDHLSEKKIICHDEAEARPDFIMICGNELSNERHHTALGIDKYIGDEKSLQDGVTRTVEAGGVPVLNHPMDPPVSAADFIATERLNHLEVFNGGRREDTPGSEQLWDSILSDPGGRLVYAVASDDNHYKKANVGKGWIMVEARSLNESEIVESIRQGRFYATTGVLADSYSVRGRVIRIASSNCDSIFFIGRNGKLLRSFHSGSARYRIRGDEGYVRVKMKGPGGTEAWMQPLMTVRK